MMASPAAASITPRATAIPELLPVSGRDSAFFAGLAAATFAAGAVVVGVDAATVVGVDAATVVGVASGATGVALRAVEAGESPALFTALMLTE